MKLYVTAKDICIPLTWAEWDMLRCREDEYDELNHNKPYVFICDTWKFTNSDLIDNWEWNGHFGANIFFRAESKEGTCAEMDAMRFLQKYVKPIPEYIVGLHQGESGADMVMPSKLSRFKRAVFEAGFDTGQRVGVKKALEYERN